MTTRASAPWIVVAFGGLTALGAATVAEAPYAPVAEGRAVLPDPVSDADFYEFGRPRPEKVELGRLLFFDKILSGNRNISCATCHHPGLATADNLPLGLGEGAEGLGSDRRAGTTLAQAVHERVPRNSPALFNLGAREFQTLFHDGRVEDDPDGHYKGGFISPAKWKLPEGLDNVLAVQALFPVASPTEMAGQRGENPIADAAGLNNVAGPGGVWDQLSARLREVPEYVERFRQAFPEQVTGAADVEYLLAANAIAAFEIAAFRADQSPFDEFLRGSSEAMDGAARRGMDLFYGDAGCSSCHSGAFQTDHDFHAIAMPQIGPGKGDGSHAGYWSASGEKAFVEDFGRAGVTFRDEDRFRFRTPSLRNVAATGPWGHDGAYSRLEGVVRHHLDPVGALNRFRVDAGYLPALPAVLESSVRGSTLSTAPLGVRRRDAFLARDGWVQATPELRARIAAANELEARHLSNGQVRDLIAFLHALTDPSVARLEELIPARVPSGLPVER